MGVNSLTQARKSKEKRSVQSRREAKIFYLLISPWIIGLLAFKLGPMIESLYLSFTNDDLLSPPRWVGWLNYSIMFHDPLFWQSLKVTFLYSIIAVPASLVISLAIAMLLNNAVSGMRWFRTIFYLPSVLPGIAVMILWVYIFNPNLGLLNAILADFGIQGPAWIFSVHWALPSLVIMSLWTAGGNMLIWLAGLKGVPDYLYEAASLDGAGTWAKFRHVTIPMITPTIFFNLIMGLIGALQTFSQGYVMTSGGPQNATLFFNLYLFNNAFGNFRMGYASALAWILFIIIMVFSLIVIRSSAAWVYYEGERR